MLSFICSGCGGFGHTPEDSLDSGTTLTCDGCGAKTIVELHSPDGYKKRHEMELQINEAEKLKQGYYDEAAKGWQKFRDAERLIDEAKRIIGNWDDYGAVGALAELEKLFTEKRGSALPTRDCGCPGWDKDGRIISGYCLVHDMKKPSDRCPKCNERTENRPHWCPVPG